MRINNFVKGFAGLAVTGLLIFGAAKEEANKDIRAKEIKSEQVDRAVRDYSKYARQRFQIERAVKIADTAITDTVKIQAGKVIKSAVKNIK